MNAVPRREKGWVWVFVVTFFGYIILIQRYLAPKILRPTGRRSQKGIIGFEKAEILVSSLQDLDGLAQLGESIIFSEKETNKLWRHEDGSGLIRIGHSLLMGKVATMNHDYASDILEYSSQALVVALKSSIELIFTSDGHRILLGSFHNPKEIALHFPTKDLYLIDDDAVWKISAPKRNRTQLQLGLHPPFYGLAISDTHLFLGHEHHIIQCQLNQNEHACHRLYDLSRHGTNLHLLGGLALDPSASFLFLAFAFDVIMLDIITAEAATENKTNNNKNIAAPSFKSQTFFLASLLDIFSLDSSSQKNLGSDIFLAEDGYLYLTTQDSLLRFSFSSSSSSSSFSPFSLLQGSAGSIYSFISKTTSNTTTTTRIKSKDKKSSSRPEQQDFYKTQVYTRQQHDAPPEEKNKKSSPVFWHLLLKDDGDHDPKQENEDPTPHFSHPPPPQEDNTCDLPLLPPTTTPEINE